jgi:hypothetical protein
MAANWSAVMLTLISHRERLLTRGQRMPRMSGLASRGLVKAVSPADQLSMSGTSASHSPGYIHSIS